MVSSTLAIKALASILSVISVTNAHMIMKTPIPFGRGIINNSPLAADGSDYPCKNIFTLTDPVNDVNHLVPGVANTLSFTGSAVHGGGSCQVALTKDPKPDKSSTWSVIKSIEGGCPANVDGNLPADPNGNGASTFQYTVPVGFPEGEYTIAWTWFNRIGNREMYMNCGKAVVASSKKRYAPAAPKIEHRAADYPDIFKANLGIFQCAVPEGINVAFPNPGASVQTIGSVSPPNNCGVASSPSTGSGTGSGTGASSSAVASVKPTTGTSAATSAANAGATGGGFASGGGGKATTTAAAVKSTGRPGVFVSGAAPQSTQAAESSVAATATVVPAAPTASTSPSGSNGSGSVPSTGSNVQGSACSQEGAWACSADGKSFQRCASGTWSTSMQVAAGTTCSPGVSMNFSIKAISLSANAKRDLIAHEHRSPHRRRSLHLLS